MSQAVKKKLDTLGIAEWAMRAAGKVNKQYELGLSETAIRAMAYVIEREHLSAQRGE
jgi:hypothetical protein